MPNSNRIKVKNYLITGAAGFIGSNIAQALSEQGHQIVVCDRFRTGEKWRNLEGVLVSDYVMPNDIIDWINFEKDNIDAIIHMGAISATTETDVDKIVVNNFKLSSDLWSLASKHNIPFIYASSAATYGDGARGFDDDETAKALSLLRPLNAYGWSKLIFDRRVVSQRDAGRPLPPQWAGLKFFNVYGPNEQHKGDMRSVIHKVFPMVYRNQQISLFKSHRTEYSDGGQLRDFIYVKDCVKIILWLLNNSSVSGIFNVGTGQPRSFSDLVECVASILRKKANIQYVDIPENIRNNYQYYTKANIDKIRGSGYSNNFHSLEQGIEDYINSDLILRIN